MDFVRTTICRWLSIRMACVIEMILNAEMELAIHCVFTLCFWVFSCERRLYRLQWVPFDG